MGVDEIHMALATAVVALAGALVAAVKYGYSELRKVNEDRIKEQKSAASKVEKTLEKVLPLAESMASACGDMVRLMEAGKNEQ
jgi:phage-related minor tail protein